VDEKHYLLKKIEKYTEIFIEKTHGCRLGQVLVDNNIARKGG